MAAWGPSGELGRGIRFGRTPSWPSKEREGDDGDDHHHVAVRTPFAERSLPQRGSYWLRNPETSKAAYPAGPKTRSQSGGRHATPPPSCTSRCLLASNLQHLTLTLILPSFSWKSLVLPIAHRPVYRCTSSNCAAHCDYHESCPARREAHPSQHPSIQRRRRSHLAQTAFHTTTSSHPSLPITDRLSHTLPQSKTQLHVIFRLAAAHLPPAIADGQR